MKKRPNLRVIRGGKRKIPPNQLSLFRTTSEIDCKKPRTVDLVVEQPVGLTAETTGDKTLEGRTVSEYTPINLNLDYNITKDSLNPFFSKVTILKGRRGYDISHQDHFLASQKAHFGAYDITANEDFIRGPAIHELLINLRGPSEILSWCIGDYEVKAMNGEEYQRLLRSPFDIIIPKLIRHGWQYNTIRVMRRIEEKKYPTPIPSLSWRLSRVSDEARREFHRAFKLPLNLVRDPYRTEMAPKEDPESFYYNGIDTYVGKLISIFKQLYALKTSQQ